MSKSTGPNKKRSLMAVYRHVEGDDRGNEQRQKASMKRMMAEVMKMHDEPDSIPTPPKKSDER